MGLFVGGGNVGGAVPAIDSNHLYVYACEESSGSTTLANTGSGANGALTLQGTEGTAFALGSRKLARYRNGVRFLADTNARGAISAATASIAATTLSIESYVCVHSIPTNPGVVIALDAGANDSFYVAAFVNAGVNGVSPFFYCGIKIGGVDNNTGAAGNLSIAGFEGGHSIRLGVPQHVLATYDKAGSPSLKLYVDGVLVASNATPTGTPATFTRVALGNIGSAAANAMRGSVLQARVSNVARPVAYAIAATEALYSL